jgi:hypothetical protein
MHFLLWNSLIKHNTPSEYHQLPSQCPFYFFFCAPHEGDDEEWVCSDEASEGKRKKGEGGGGE